jgi:hypothetical protein
MKTLTNRDFINRIYILRYEDCVELVRVSFDHSTSIDFVNAVERLYWSFIVPRQSKLKEDYPAILGKIDELRQKANNMETQQRYRPYLELLEIISRRLWQVGVNRPEKQEADLDHVVIEEMEVKA